MPVELIQQSENFRHNDGGVYPDNWQTVMMFADMLTQWRMGPAGPIGLDYQSLPMVMRIRGIRTADRSELFDGIKIMERAALQSFKERRG